MVSLKIYNEHNQYQITGLYQEVYQWAIENGYNLLVDKTSTVVMDSNQQVSLVTAKGRAIIYDWKWKVRLENSEMRSRYERELYKEAELLATWGKSLISVKEDQTSFILIKSVYFKLRQVRHHCRLALWYGDKAVDAMENMPFSSTKKSNDFKAICEFDSMIHALNSLMDIVAKVLLAIYFNNSKKRQFAFKDLMNPKNRYINELANKAPEVVQVLNKIAVAEEREYVRKFCNEIKHMRALFNSSSCHSFDFDKDLYSNGFEIRAFYNEKEQEIHWLHQWAPKLEKFHRVKLCEIGKKILKFMGEEPSTIDANFLKLIENTTNIEY